MYPLPAGGAHGDPPEKMNASSNDTIASTEERSHGTQRQICTTSDLPLGKIIPRLCCTMDINLQTEQKEKVLYQDSHLIPAAYYFNEASVETAYPLPIYQRK